MGILRYTGENLGSLIRIDYIPSWQISTFNPGPNNTIAAADIILYEPYSWQNIYCSQDTMGHQQTLTNDENGEIWQHQVQGFIPGDESDIETGLLQLTQQRYVLRITRPNGMVKIVGSVKQPLNLKIDSNSQLSVPGTPGTTVGFSGIVSTRALILT